MGALPQSGWPSVKGQLRLAACLALFVLPGCAAINGYPTQPDSLPTTITSLDKATLGNLIGEYNNPATTADRRQAIRNEIIYSDISQIDSNFNAFKLSLNSQQNQLSIGTDFVSLALAGLGATVGATETKAALAAASAGVIGAKAAVDKDILYQKTITALVVEMEAQRSQVFAVIIKHTDEDVAKYPLEAASKDLQDYYQAGTLLAALEGVNQSAGAKAQDGKDQVAAALSVKYSYNTLSKKIENFWMPDGKTVNPDNARKLNACLSDNKIPGHIPTVINGGTDAEKLALINCAGL